MNHSEACRNPRQVQRGERATAPLWWPGAAARARLLVLVVWSAGALACGPDREAPQLLGPHVTLGTGREQFEPRADGESVLLVRGIQGAWHVWTSFLAYGFETDVLRMELTTEWQGVDESRLGGAGNVAVRPVEDAAGAAALASVGWTAVVYNPTCAHGHRLRVNLSVLDKEGRFASDTREWIMEVPEAERSSECAP